MLNVLLVEDDLDLAQTVIDYLELKEIRCDFYSNGKAGLSAASKNQYSCIVLDISLPRMDGLTVCETLRQAGMDTPVLMLTARDKLTDKLKGFEVGADDYLTKPFDFPELLARVNALANRKSGSIKSLTVADLTMNLTTKTLTRSGLEVRLSPTGWKILELLLRRSPQVVTKQCLIELIWGDDQPDSESLKVHMFKLREKVDKPFTTKLIQTVGQEGFTIKESHD